MDVPPYGETKITHANYMGELSGGLKQGTTDIIQAVSDLTSLTSNQVHYFQVPGHPWHPWQGKDPIVGTVLDYWVANTPQLEQILKSNFQ